MPTNFYRVACSLLNWEVVRNFRVRIEEWWVNETAQVIRKSHKN